MANTNVQNFLLTLGMQLLTYGAAKLSDAANKTNTASFATTRTAIYTAGLQALNQELQDVVTKIDTPAAAATTTEPPTPAQ